MAKKNSSKTATQTSISNSQPRIQSLTGWTGINWSSLPMDVDGHDVSRGETYWRGRGQSDSKPNYLLLQNNLTPATNNTIETTYEPIALNKAPEGTTLSGVTCVYKDYIYVVATNSSNEQSIYRTKVPTINKNYNPDNPSSEPWTINNWSAPLPMADKNNLDKSKRVITSINTFANKLIVLCRYDGKAGEMFDGNLYDTNGNDIIETNGISNAKAIPNPSTLEDEYSNLHPTKQGFVETGNVVRLTFKAIWLNKYGSTLETKSLSSNILWVPDGPDSFTARQYVSLSGTVPAGYDITGLDIYCSQDESADNIFCGHVNLPAGQTTWSFNWLGALMDTTQWTTSLLTIPKTNTTRGVDACYCDQYDARLYFYGGTEKDRLYIGGNPGNELSVATGYGGAFIDIEPGSGHEIRKVLKFKTYNGATITTLLTYHPNTQKASRYNILETNITLTNEYATKGYDSEKVDGVVGAASYYGADTFIDGLYAINRYGLAFTTKQQENTNNLKVMYCSDPIHGIFKSLLAKDISNSRMLAICDTIFIAFADTSNKVYTNESYDTKLDEVIFAYDTGKKSWFTFTLHEDSTGLNPIRHIFHLDSESFWEGVGIVRSNGLALIPTTGDDFSRIYKTNKAPRFNPTYESFFATHEITGRSPITNLVYVDQFEVRFDYLCCPEGLSIWVEGYDYYGRHFKIDKKVYKDKLERQTTVYLIVRKYVEGINLYIKGKAHYRLTHINMKAFQKQNRIGSHLGFDSRAKYIGQHGQEHSEHNKIKTYNDLKYMLLTS